MKNFKGTRTFDGSWSICQQTLKHGMERIVGYGMEEVCLITNKTTTGMMGGEHPDNEKQEANAKLIASAPELLKALQNMMSIKGLIQYPDDTKEEHQGEAEAVQSFINQAEGAIKKATE